jgi:putative membrane protein
MLLSGGKVMLCQLSRKAREIMESKLREYLANERTYLAWLRTAIAVIAFGFVLDRFSLYIRHFSPAAIPETEHLDTSLIGTGLMWIGTFLMPTALFHFLAVQRDIDQPLRTRSHLWLVIGFGSLVTLIAFYLSLTLTRMGHV